MQQHMVVAVMASVIWALVGGTALGQVAGSTTLGVTVDEQKVLAMGWSAKKQILGKAVYNSSGEKIGEVEDLIITPEKAVSYAIVGTGGFLGMAEHNVAIPVGQLKVEGDKLMLPGAMGLRAGTFSRCRGLRGLWPLRSTTNDLWVAGDKARSRLFERGRSLR